MIVKIKTFSGETLYIPEEDYLKEVMYSENLEEREFGVPSKQLNDVMRRMPKAVTAQTGHVIPKHNLRQLRHTVQTGYNAGKKGTMTAEQAAQRRGDFGGMFGMKKRAASDARNIANTEIARADLLSRARQVRLGAKQMPKSNTARYFQ